MNDLSLADTGTCYEMELADGTACIWYRWARQMDAELGEAIIDLMRRVTATAPIIGFGTSIGEDESRRYLQELTDNLASSKCRLLTIFRADELIAICTLRRNLNPNNRHIADLAKGMIDERHRGHAILPAAFHEIALQCEQDKVELLTLDVRANTPAQKAWERCGFRIYGTLDDYARVNGRSLAGHFMCQTVASLKAGAQALLQQHGATVVLR